MNQNTSHKHDLTTVREALKRLLPQLTERYGVRSLGVFGSYVHGDQHDGSDLDLLVEFNEAPGLLSFIELEQLLSDVLGIEVDLVMKQALKPRIGERVLEEVVEV